MMYYFSRFHSFRPCLFAFLSLCLGFLLIWFPPPFWWAGTGFLLAGFGVLWQTKSSTLPSTPAPISPEASASSQRQPWYMTTGMDILCLLLLVGVVFAMLPEVSLGHLPINHDHSVHFAKIWQLQDDFLAQGRLWGWSHQWFAGYPAQYLYPFGADLFVLLIRGLSFGFLSLGQAYAIAFSLHWVLLGYAIYRCAQQGFSRSVGLLAALLLVTDIGSYRMGGWVFTARWGVWPMNLSLAFSLLAVAHLKTILCESNSRSIASFGLWMGLALLTHPIQLIHFSMLIPVALLTHWLTQQSPSMLPAMSRLFLASILGVAIGGLWLFPFFSTQAYSHTYGAPWWDTVRIATGIYDLDLLLGTWSFVVALGCLGLFAMLFSRQFFPLLLALLSFILLLTSSSSFVQSFHLTNLSIMFQKVQFQRFAVLLKPYFFLASSYVLLWTCRHFFSLFSSNSSKTNRSFPLFVHLFLLGTLTSPILHPLFNQYLQRHISHIYRDNEKEDVELKKDDPHHKNKQALLSWAKEQFPRDKKQGFFRLALFVGKHEHRFFDLAPALSVPVYKVGFTPSSNFRYKMEESSTQLFKTLNVLYVLSLWRLNPSEYTLVREFGNLYVYRFRSWDPKPFDILHGTGKISLVSFANEEIVLHAEPGSQGKLRLHVSYFPRWQATHNEQSIPIYVSQLPKNENTAFMTVDLKEGVYRFRFRRSLGDFLSLSVFGLGLLFVGLLYWANRLPFLEQRWLQLQEELGQIEVQHASILRYGFLGLFVVVLLFATGLALWHPRQLYEHPYLQGKSFRLGYDFLENLLQAQAATGTGEHRKQCRSALDRFYCGPEEWQHINIRQVRLGANQWKRCIWMHPQENAPVSLTYTQANVGNTITGYFGIAQSGLLQQPSPVVFTIKVQNQTLYRSQTLNDITLYHYHVPLPKALQGKPTAVTFTVEAKSPGRRHFCFHAQGIRLHQP